MASARRSPHRAASATRAGSGRATGPRGGGDPNTPAPLEEALDTSARKHSRVVVDVSGVSFVDSTFLNLLLRTHQMTLIRVAGPTLQLRRLLEITGADHTVLDNEQGRMAAGLGQAA
ncbi:STAS domain-containing protein [Streptomyces sp. NPDC058295]|uniref:STAS domain-containing protein n=1 Tax=Streptomyces sp. NPDC058295 TaxID=3346431 RepID=UPI0036EEF471